MMASDQGARRQPTSHTGNRPRTGGQIKCRIGGENVKYVGSAKLVLPVVLKLDHKKRTDANTQPRGVLEFGHL
ncbi:MAG: hypothetical protein HYR55_02730 [Acidobacteria bacterium]|nr:hypothetical protein [Acidobacteriota bacterium]MBI3656261.1 hypothetical protein [Acidobacteriota bacterium]